MARRKTISISPKPYTGVAISGNEAVALLADSSGQSVNLDAREENLRESEETATSLNPLGYAIYGAFFCISYSVVFSAILLGRFLPGSGLIGRGLHDGSDAAQRTLESQRNDNSVGH